MNGAPFRTKGAALLLAVWAVALQGAAAAGAEQVEEREAVTRAAAPDVAVEITNLKGEVLVQVWDRPEVRVEAVKTARARNEERAKRLLRRVKYDVEGEGRRIQIEARHATERGESDSWLGAFFGGGEGAWVDLLVRLPRGASVEVSSTSGDIDVRDLAGPVRIEATSGDIVVMNIEREVEVDCTSGSVEVADVRGNLTVHTTSGGVTVEDVDGRLEYDGTSGDLRARDLRGGAALTSLSGDVTCAGTRGAFEVSTSSGDVILRDHEGTLTVETSSGDSQVHLLPPVRGAYRVEASSGSVTIELPPGADCQLDISTATGALDVRMPVEVKEVSRHRLVAVAGGGKATLLVTTASGDVRISESSGARP